MINFFRKIRKKLADDNQFFKYSRYAIGEILLVVIGILIALQINTIKNELGDRKTEKLVLQNLSADLEKDIKDIDRLIQLKSDQVQACNYMIKFFINTDQMEKDSIAFTKNLLLAYHFYEHYPNNVGFDIAKSSGDLFKVSNKGLVDSLATYFSFTNLVQYIDETTRFTSNYTLVLLRKYRFPAEHYSFTKDSYTNYVGAEFPKEEFFRDFEMENYFSTMILRLGVGIELAKTKKGRAAELLELIRNELEKF
jgi:hypothetical protein